MVDFLVEEIVAVLSVFQDVKLSDDVKYHNYTGCNVSQPIKQGIHNIKKALYNQQLGRPHEATPMSATEVAERMAQLANEIGPAFGRLMKELVEPVIQRVIYILKDKGLIQIPTIDGKQIQIVSQSPLATAQRMQDVTNMDQFLQRMVSVFGPQILQVLVDQDKAAKWYAEKQQIPLDLLRKPEEQAALLQETVGQLAPVLEQQRGEPPI